MKNNAAIFLEDFIAEIIDNEQKINRFSIYFKRWVHSFETLNKLTEKVYVYNNFEILIKDKHKFLNELNRLSKTKLIKSTIIKNLT